MAVPDDSSDPNRDSDQDQLTDAEEVFDHGTDPLNPDSDEDSAPDDVEVLSGSDPTDPSDLPKED